MLKYLNVIDNVLDGNGLQGMLKIQKNFAIGGYYTLRWQCFLWA